MIVIMKILKLNETFGIFYLIGPHGAIMAIHILCQSLATRHQLIKMVLFIFLSAAKLQREYICKHLE